MTIRGHDLPGRTFCNPSGEQYDDVRVGIQVRKDPEQLLSADADSVHWDLEITVVTDPDGSFDFKGPAVQGRRGDRFLYLIWGNVDDAGEFHMFRRAKLMLNRIKPDIVSGADQETHQLVARVRLSDDHGAPRCARVDRPDITWSVATRCDSEPTLG